MSFGAHVSKTPCKTHGYRGMGLAQCFAYACTKTHSNRSKFGGYIAQISAHQFSLSSINFIINSTPQGPWERKGQKTHVTPYVTGIQGRKPRLSGLAMDWSKFREPAQVCTKKQKIPRASLEG